MNIDSKYSYINVLFYSVWHNCGNEVIEALTDDDGVDVKNITVYFLHQSKFLGVTMKKITAGVLGSFCILRAILLFGVGWGNFDIFILFTVGVFLWFLVLSSS